MRNKPIILVAQVPSEMIEILQQPGNFYKTIFQETEIGPIQAIFKNRYTTRDFILGKLKEKDGLILICELKEEEIDKIKTGEGWKFEFYLMNYPIEIVLVNENKFDDSGGLMPYHG